MIDELSTRPARTDQDVVTRTIMGETILIPIRGNLADMQVIFALNPVADFVWKQLDGKKDINRILEAVTTEFDVEPEQAAGDLKDFLGQLLDEGLIALK